VPPAGPPPKTILFLAKEDAEKAKVIIENAQIPIIAVKSLFFMVILLFGYDGQLIIFQFSFLG
jgi:hypothetical protein